jgi:hypothetical protein
MSWDMRTTGDLSPQQQVALITDSSNPERNDNEMNENTTIQIDIARMIEIEPIRRVVEVYPEVMPILAGYGLDLCCGGGHTIAEAARLHELDAELLAAQIAAVVAVRARG